MLSTDVLSSRLWPSIDHGRWLLSLNIKNQPLLASNFFSAVSSPFSTFRELKSVRTLVWSRLWLERDLWLVWCSAQTTQIFSITTARLFGFLIIHVFTGVALLIFFKNFSFTFTTWLFDARDALLVHISVLDMPSS